MELSNISATLKYGEFVNKTDKKKLLIILIFGLSAFAVFTVFLILEVVDYFYGKGDMILIIIFGIVLGFIGLVVPYYILVGILKKRKQKREINFFFFYAVELQAKATEIGVWSGWLKTKSYKLQVGFDFEGKNYSFESKNKHIEFVFWEPDGYDEIWQKYINKNIKILYSPKYNEVMIIGD